MTMVIIGALSVLALAGCLRSQMARDTSEQTRTSASRPAQ